MDEPKKKAGRTRKYATRRPSWSIRLEVSVGDRVRAMAEANGRSISEQCEHLITTSFELKDLLDQQIKRNYESEYQLRETQATLGAFVREEMQRRKASLTADAVAEIVERTMRKVLAEPRS